MRALVFVAILSAVMFGVTCWAGTQSKPAKSEGAPTAQSGIEQQQERAKPPEAGQAVEFSAKLLDREKKAQAQEATVEVKLAGIQLIDPAAVNEQPQRGQGHLHYQVGNGPVIATTATKLSFHELNLGEQKITVMLVGNNHQPLGPQETLTVTIPKGDEDRAQRR
jgi:hemolysin activation/secretion protein